MLHGCPPSPDAWGRLNVVTPFHHLSEDSHINSSLREGPLRHLVRLRPLPTPWLRSPPSAVSTNCRSASTATLSARCCLTPQSGLAARLDRPKQQHRVSNLVAESV